MKYGIIFLLIIGCMPAVVAQSAKDEKEVIAKTQLLSQTVFGSKDSATLDQLLAASVLYGHSGGNVQDRNEAFQGIIKNKSVYSDTAVRDIYVLFGNKNTAVVKHLFEASESKTDGTVVPLKFNMMLVWIKEGDKWKLFARQAVKRS